MLVKKITTRCAAGRGDHTGYDPPMKISGLDIPDENLADFCRRWKIAELALFGSIAP